MRRNCQSGFSLIEIMIVIAIIAILAAVAIPNLVRSRVASNQSSAAASLIAIRTGQVQWRTGDFDANGMPDFWTLDIAGLYATPQTDGKPVKVVDLNIARADTAPGQVYANLATTGVARAGYYFAVMDQDQKGTAYRQDPDGDGNSHTNQDLYGTCAYPQTFPQSGRVTFIINQAGEIYYRDNGGILQTDWPADDPASVGWVTGG